MNRWASPCMVASQTPWKIGDEFFDEEFMLLEL
jgi:hypothetical protein